MTDECNATADEPDAVPDGGVAPDAEGRIPVRCRCGRTLRVPAFRAGGSVRCPVCGSHLAIPAVRRSGRPDPCSPESAVEDTLRLVEAELKRDRSGAGKPGANLVTLVLSLMVFMALGMFHQPLSGIVLLIVVLLIHEMGHWIGMKLFKYDDVRMFFIPLFGAAVTGTERAPSAARSAMVSLLGPTPGILIGIGVGFAYLSFGHPLLRDAARAFLVLNLFNLLPFYPLDGGRILDAILFSRHPALELSFKIVATGIFAWIAVAFRDVLFGIFAFFMFASLHTTRIVANAARTLRSEFRDAGTLGSASVPADRTPRILEILSPNLSPAQRKPSITASLVTETWRRVRNRPCSIGATAGLLLCYALVFLIGLFSAGVFEVAVDRMNQLRKDTEAPAAGGPHAKSSFSLIRSRT